ncbi:hypothetical protein JKP88DRAFT_253538 [Tribonema minus]|uniref:Uncharacterized protein n=1 Tax=Tribonema minus TaxID=303371 RepID=A0A835ZDI8_9STRA|nr:hypothetical protein JKP88DRAFT_253538 [Tribonema minus]
MPSPCMTLVEDARAYTAPELKKYQDDVAAMCCIGQRVTQKLDMCRVSVSTTGQSTKHQPVSASFQGISCHMCPALARAQHLARGGQKCGRCLRRRPLDTNMINTDIRLNMRCLKTLKPMKLLCHALLKSEKPLQLFPPHCSCVVSGTDYPAAIDMLSCGCTQCVLALKWFKLGTVQPLMQRRQPPHVVSIACLKQGSSEAILMRVYTRSKISNRLHASVSVSYRCGTSNPPSLRIIMWHDEHLRQCHMPHMKSEWLPKAPLQHACPQMVYTPDHR